MHNMKILIYNNASAVRSCLHGEMRNARFFKIMSFFSSIVVIEPVKADLQSPRCHDSALGGRRTDNKADLVSFRSSLF